MAKWLAKNPEKREQNRLKNIEWRKKNREKCCQATANWRARNPTYESSRKLKERYGITPEQYEEMFTIQEGKCAICGSEETARHNHSNEVQKLAVDHCHITGKIRALLCQDCNRGLGKFKDDPARLIQAAEYVKRHSS